MRPAGPTLTAFEDFITKVPPGKVTFVKCKSTQYPNNMQRSIIVSETVMYCERCSHDTQFAPSSDNITFMGNATNQFVHYVCRNCTLTMHTFAIRTEIDAEHSHCMHVVKFGQRPQFGPRTPRRFLALLGDDMAATYLKGRQAENQGMGIAAFAYYRRVLDAKKNVLFDKIIAAAQQLRADEALINELTSAKETTRFTEATKSLRTALPPSLLINGENPLTLIHDALSDGIHNLTDDECLSRAENVRVLLVHFVEQLNSALEKDQAVLIAAAAIKRNAAKKAAPDNN